MLLISDPETTDVMERQTFDPRALIGTALRRLVTTASARGDCRSAVRRMVRLAPAMLAATALAGPQATAFAASGPSGPEMPALPGVAQPEPHRVLAQAATPFPTAQEIWRHLPDSPDNPARPPIRREDRIVPQPSPAGQRPTTRPAQQDGPAARDSALSEARVVIHYPARSGPAASQDLAGRLRAAGTGEVEIRRVPLRVERQSIRYFHDGDRAVSQRVDALVQNGRSSDIADFTHYAPRPRRGTIEIWLP